MAIDTSELIAICEQLPENELSEVADFARFLLSKHDDEQWERTIADRRSRPKLEAFLKSALAEGSTPLADSDFEQNDVNGAPPARENR